MIYNREWVLQATSRAKVANREVGRKFPERTFITYVLWDEHNAKWRIGHVTEEGIGEITTAGDDRPWAMVRRGVVLMQRRYM